MESIILGTRYELLERVGMGGMAVVYKAMDKMLNRYVAVKILREEFKENEEFIRRFKVESQAAASLSHQNIVQIYDVGEENGLHYIVMELLEGETLKQYMNSKGGKLSRREAANFSMQICRALEHAHSKHVVHRDIKPQNIVITESGKIKVADFGIARAANNSTTVNAEKSAIGSAHYLSPEQARGGYTDHRSDIYSLGVVMYEMFTGKLPFDAEESLSVVMQHLHEDPAPPSEVNASLPPGIEAIILRAMRKEQRLRYDTATEILEDLVLVYQNPGVSLSKLNACKGDPQLNMTRKPSSGKSTKSRTTRKKKKRSAHKGLLIAALTAFLAMIALIGFALHLLFFGTGEEVEIPSLIGMTFDEAAIAAKQASTDDVTFTVIEGGKEHSDHARNTIISQSPEGGSNVKRNREIEVVLSLGPVVLELEDYTGKDYEDIREELESLGLKVIIEEHDNDTYEEGIIYKHVPSEGKQMAEGDEITLYVSLGTENTVVPNVVGLPLEDAITAIEKNDLTVGSITEEASDEYPTGKICRQSKSPFSTVPMDTKIDLFVSTGEKKDSEDEKNDNEKPQDEKPQEEKPQEEKPQDTGNKPSDKPTDTPSKTPVNTPSTTPAPEKTVSVSLTNLTKDKAVSVRLLGDGVPLYESDITSATGNATVSLKIEKTTKVDIYYDGVYIATKEVKY